MDPERTATALLAATLAFAVCLYLFHLLSDSSLQEFVILLFAGQYGEGYADILEAFLRAADIELNLQQDLYLVLSYHPKTTGELEREAIRKHSHPRLRLIPQGVNTAEVATMSGAVITWRSTVGILAAFLGKPVLYFNFNPHDYTNNLVEKGPRLRNHADDVRYGAAAGARTTERFVG